MKLKVESTQGMLKEIHLTLGMLFMSRVRGAYLIVPLELGL